MEFLKDPYFIVFSVMVAVLIYETLLKGKLSKKLTPKQISVIDYATERAVVTAEEAYLKDRSVNRKELALEYIFDITRQAGVIPEKHIDFIEKIIKSYVAGLRPTHERLKENSRSQGS